MILQPAVLALLVGSLLTSFMLLYALCYGIRILARWNIKSGSELQLTLERRTYLISTILSYTMAFQLLSLFLFIYTADHLHSQFSGAMCIQAKVSCLATPDKLDLSGLPVEQATGA